MLIKNERAIATQFRYVTVGKVIRFVDEEDLSDLTYMVICECQDEDGECANVICLDDGTFYHADDFENVEILNAELIIKR